MSETYSDFSVFLAAHKLLELSGRCPLPNGVTRTYLRPVGEEEREGMREGEEVEKKEQRGEEKGEGGREEGGEGEDEKGKEGAKCATTEDNEVKNLPSSLVTQPAHTVLINSLPEQRNKSCHSDCNDTEPGGQAAKAMAIDSCEEVGSKRCDSSSGDHGALPMDTGENHYRVEEGGEGGVRMRGVSAGTDREERMEADTEVNQVGGCGAEVDEKEEAVLGSELEESEGGAAMRTEEGVERRLGVENGVEPSGEAAQREVKLEKEEEKEKPGFGKFSRSTM